MICKAGVEVPGTEGEASRKQGWSRAEGAMIADAPDWSLHRRCEGDEVCAVYKRGKTVTARYCSQNQCSNYWTGPAVPCSDSIE